MRYYANSLDTCPLIAVLNTMNGGTLSALVLWALTQSDIVRLIRELRTLLDRFRTVRLFCKRRIVFLHSWLLLKCKHGALIGSIVDHKQWTTGEATTTGRKTLSSHPNLTWLTCWPGERPSQIGEAGNASLYRPTLKNSICFPLVIVVTISRSHLLSQCSHWADWQTLDWRQLCFQIFQRSILKIFVNVWMNFLVDRLIGSVAGCSWIGCNWWVGSKNGWMFICPNRQNSDHNRLPTGARFLRPLTF